MTLQQIKQEIAALDDEELKEFSAWLESHLAEVWDRQIEKDANNGTLDRLVHNLGIDLADERNPRTGS
ncbi:hypothetical protein [Brevifollis gellanilyticus]|uniref:Uncharacterized protein n=1 Tax=Brevifollis gellanilyticus TaxID=748831 RepID=A0A512MAA2_9BACT|nr:hypothetical protein [Brevifollis gellanilyticus]GEP43643.1 hypothetical protein BGE01nite_29340 [Brevifollis gellanilyticus]